MGNSGAARDCFRGSVVFSCARGLSPEIPSRAEAADPPQASLHPGGIGCLPLSPRCQGAQARWFVGGAYSIRATRGVWSVTLVLRETDFVGRVCFPVHEA